MMLSDPSAPGEKTAFFLRYRSLLIESLLKLQNEIFEEKT